MVLPQPPSASLSYDHRGTGLSTAPAIQIPGVTVSGPGKQPVWTASKPAPRQGHRTEAIGDPSHSRLEPRWGFPRIAHSKRDGEAPRLALIALTLSDEEGASLVHRSQQLPLSILPADGPEEPSGKQ